MRIVRTNYLNDGKMFNNGQPASLIHIEHESDYDILLNNIIRTNYYDSKYFETHIGYKDRRLKLNTIFLSSTVKYLGPKALLEFGSGRADILFLLRIGNIKNVQGIDLSEDVLKEVWPEVRNRVDCGDILHLCNVYLEENRKFDTFIAFDTWEHLHPKKLHNCISSMIRIADDNAFFFFIIPAFGTDRVFGEIFPLEFEENRENFDKRLPFEYLNVEKANPAIPSSGHLIWAHSEWWQKQFEAHGLKRVEELERDIHNNFGKHIACAQRSFYIFRLDSKPAMFRVNKILKKPFTQDKKWNMLVNCWENIIKFEKDNNQSVINHIDHIDFAATVSSIIDKEINQVDSYTYREKALIFFLKHVIPFKGFSKFRKLNKLKRKIREYKPMCLRAHESFEIRKIFKPSEYHFLTDNFYFDWVWTNGKGIINVKYHIKPHDNFLVLTTKGWRPFKDNILKIGLKVYVNGIKLKFAYQMENSYFFKLNHRVKVINRILISSLTFTPRKLKINEDKRKLGIDIESIRIE